MIELQSLEDHPGQFSLPHAIACDSKGRIYVADRNNVRVQVFNMRGTDRAGDPVPDNMFFLAAGDIESLPVNCCVTVVKEADGKIRVFLQAKSHPFFGEETIDPYHDLYRGKVFPLFRCTPSGFNFMPVICLDYVYRDLYQSNITTIIERANEPSPYLINCNARLSWSRQA